MGKNSNIGSQLSSSFKDLNVALKKGEAECQNLRLMLATLEEEQQQLKLKIAALHSLSSPASLRGLYGGFNYSSASPASNNQNNQLVQNASVINEKTDENEQEFKRPTNSQ